MIARWRLRSCDRVGANPTVDGPVDLRNYGRMFIGDDLRLSSRPMVSQIVTGPGGTLSIGSRVTIEHGASIAAHRSIVLGDDVYIGPYLLLMDTNFHSVSAHSKPGTERPVVIESGARIGARVTIMPGSHIGAGAHVAPGSVVAGFIPSQASVSGVPAHWKLPSSCTTVGAAIREVFGLDADPDPVSEPRRIGGWGALGVFRLVLALEERFRVHLDVEAIGAAPSVSDVERQVLAARGGPLAS